MKFYPDEFSEWPSYPGYPTYKSRSNMDPVNDPERRMHEQLKLFPLEFDHSYLTPQKLKGYEEQPLPEKNNNPYIKDLVIKDLQTRAELGKERYGTYLQGGNNRDALRDAYEEACDLLCYLRQEIYERDGK